MDAQLWKAGVVVVLGLVAALAPARVEAAAEGAQPLRAQQVIGREALNSAGRETGWVEDLLVDIDARRIEALVVAHDGRSIKVPAQGARYEEDRVRLAQDERTLDRMRRWNGRPEAGLVRVKSLLEQPLQSREGDRDIATVKDLLLDLPAGRVTHVVLDFEEGRKAEAGWVAVAADSVREGPGGLRAAFDPKHLYAPDEARRQAAAAAPPPPPRIVAEDVRLSRIVGQPVKGTDGATLGRVAAVHLDRAGRRIAALRVEQDGEGYDCSLRADGLVLRRDAVESVKPAESLASAPACRPAGGAGTLRGRDLIGAAILDPQGEVAGNIREVAVDADTGKLHYLIGGFHKGWVAPGYVVALPLRPLEQHEGRVAVRAHLSELMQYPVFEEKRIADLWSPAFAKGMDQYLEVRR